MSKRSKRRRHERRRRHMQATENKPRLPSGFRRGIEIGTTVLGELADGISPEDFIAERRSQLRRLIEPYDAVHLLGMVMFGEVSNDPDTYVESEDEGAAHVVELLAAELLIRPSRRGAPRIRR